jgi:ABC-type phosphate/phosphonate transport system substrate-binding protein
MILQRKAHASAVDSNALQMFLRENPNEKGELFSIATWGPLPPYAIVVRKTLDSQVKDALIATLLAMHETSEGREILSSFKIKRFSRITGDDLITGEEFIEATKGLSFDTVYY